MPLIGQLIRFSGVGGLATLVHVLVASAAQASLSVPAQAANLLGFSAAVLLSYIGHARLTFGVTAQSGTQFLRFIYVSLLGLGASSLTVWIVNTLLGLSFTAAMAAVVVTVPAVTYISMRFWVFADRSGNPGLPLGDIALAALMALVLLVVYWGQLLNHDLAWYQFATRDWLAGDELYRDLVEVNPPLAFYLTVPSVLIADTLQVSSTNGHYIWVALCLFLSLAWSAAVLRQAHDLGPAERSVFVVVAGLAVTLPTLDGMGQREQLMVMAFLPWVLHQAAPRPPSRGQTGAAALVAAVGMCQKPHFVLLPLAVTLLNVFEQRSLRPVLSLSNWIFLVVGLAYVGAVWLLHPAYLLDIAPMAMLVYGAYDTTFPDLVLRVSAVSLSLALLFALVARSTGLARDVRVFAVLALAGLASYILQGTGFTYHKVPLMAFGTLACLMLLLRGHPERRERLLTVLTLALILASALQQRFYPDAAARMTKAAVEGHEPIDGMAVLSTHLYLGPAVAMALETDWAMTYPANWLVPGALNRLAETDCTADPALCEDLRSIAHRNRNANIADIARMTPDLLIVDRDSGYFRQPNFDWLAFMAEDPAWAAVFAPYREIGRNGRVIFYLRDG